MPGSGTRRRSPTSESDLERVLIRASAVNGIMGARGMEVVASSEDLSDNSDVVSDRDCLGAIYGAEKLVYGGSDWIAIRDQVVQEPNDDNQHWVEQIAVLYPSAAKARNFVEESKAAWQQCAGKSVDIDNGDALDVGPRRFSGRRSQEWLDTDAAH